MPTKRPMRPKPEPSEVSSAFQFDIGDLRDFAGLVLEDANDHFVAAALWAHNAGETDIACGFLQLSADHEKARYLTPELAARERELYAEMKRREVESGWSIR